MYSVVQLLLPVTSVKSVAKKYTVPHKKNPCDCMKNTNLSASIANVFFFFTLNGNCQFPVCVKLYTLSLKLEEYLGSICK